MNSKNRSIQNHLVEIFEELQIVQDTQNME